MPPAVSESARGQAAITLTACLWSTSGLFIKLIPWHPALISGVRSLITFLFMSAVRLAFPPKAAEPNPPALLWASAFVNALTMLTFIAANKLTASANAVVLQYSAPVWAALLGWALLGEKPRAEHGAALALAGAGAALIFHDGFASGGLWGDSLALLSGVLFGANSVLLRMMKKGSPAAALRLSHLVNFFFSVPFLFLAPPCLSAASVLALLYLGVVELGCSSLLFAYGIKRVQAVQAMLLAAIEPVLNPVWVFLAAGEKPSPPALLGCALIVIAVVGSSVIGRRRQERRT